MPDLPDKSKAFFEWYNEVLELAQVTDKRYPVKGLNVWTPFGFSALSQMDATIRGAVTAIGYEEVNFPALIPETEFKKEKEHIKGFDAQVYWVTHGGTTELDVRLVLRPTSETAMYPIFALWVRSHKDLPLRVFQVVNVFRYETKTTRPLLRVREIHFFEGHTVQKDDAAATAQVQADLRSFESIARTFCVPYLRNNRPAWDRFPGAHESIALDIPVGDGRTLQIGTVHHYRDNFAKPYGIVYEGEDGQQRNGHQTTYGLSERLLGGVIITHGDAKGLVLPPALAPVQVAVVPIFGKEGKAALEAHAQALGQRLSEAGLRVRVDVSDDRPGAKYYRWEVKGVPLRLEVGAREAAEKKVTVATRLGEKFPVTEADLVPGVRAALDRFAEALRARAEAAFQAQLHVVKEASALGKVSGVRLFGWCGKEACGHAVDAAVDGALLGTLEGTPPSGAEGPAPPCIICGQGPSHWASAGQPL